MKKLVVLLVFINLLGCSRYDGECDTPPNPRIKEKNVISDSVTGEQDVYTIKTENIYGWLYDIEFNKENKRELLKSFINKKMPYTIKADEFSIELIDTHTLKVTMNKNTTDKENTLIIDLEAGNCFDRIEIVQPPSEE